LELGLRLEKDTFEAGEPVVVLVQISNRGGTPYLAQTSTEETGAHDGFAFTITDANQQPVPPAPRITPANRWIGSWNAIAPQDRLERKLFLNYWFPPLPPGRYTVRGHYVARTDDGHRIVNWPATLSAPVTFEIVPVGSTKLDVRIQRLAAQAEKGDPVAVDFLGFTGDPYAFAPLLAAAYHEEADIRRRAVNGLNYLPDPADNIRAVLRSVEERGPSDALVHWLHARAVPAGQLLPLYVAALAATEPAVRVAAVTGLRLMRDSDAPARRAAVLRAVADPDAEVRLEALLILMAEQDAAAQRAVAEVAARDPSPRLRRIATQHLRTREEAAPPDRTAHQ
jgi:hypothetical protein